tara:strand:+ start:239 stop:442 length:204 start_codon:yes stop_codon:yes gene_type:complete
MKNLILPVKIAMVILLPAFATVLTCLALGFAFSILFAPEPFGETYFLIIEIVIYLLYTLGFWKWLFK